MSRGVLALCPAGADRAPLIRPRYFSEESDIECLRLGLHRAWEVLAAWGVDPRRDEMWPPPAVFDDRHALAALLRRHATSYFHLAGTCAMGSRAEAGAVTDWTGRVRGLDNIWVCDASVMPVVPAANTALPVAAIALAPRCRHRGDDRLIIGA